ncbi:MAG: helix-turn-helix transcriptional regulator [Clostridiales bacterium]|nr:helix-turn-helix transcriptional regulator [Clostridiales bacterium]
MDHQLDVNRLKKCREKAGLSKRETSKRVGVSQPAYLRYEDGSRTPSIQVITAIARELNTSVDYLTGKTKENAPDFIYTDKNVSPTLFSIIESCKDFDEKKLELLKKYCDSLI